MFSKPNFWVQSRPNETVASFMVLFPQLGVEPAISGLQVRQRSLSQLTQMPTDRAGHGDTSKLR